MGKTWLMKEFGRLHYQKTFYFSFDRDASLANLFKTTKDPIRLLEQLGAIQGAVPEGKAYPGAELILTPPATPEPVLIDESMVNNMLSEYKSHFPKVISKKEAAQ